MKTPRWLFTLWLFLLLAQWPAVARAESRIFDMELVVVVPKDHPCVIAEGSKTAFPTQAVRFFCDVARRTLDPEKYQVIYIYQRSVVEENGASAHLVLLGAGDNNEPFALHRSFAFGEDIPQAVVLEGAIQSFFDGTEGFSAEYYDEIPFYNAWEAADFAEEIIPTMPDFQPEYSVGDSVEKVHGVLWALVQKAQERGESFLPYERGKEEKLPSDRWYSRRMPSFRARPAIPWAKGLDLQTHGLQFNFLESQPFLPYSLSAEEQALMEEVIQEQFELLRAFSEGQF